MPYERCRQGFWRSGKGEGTMCELHYWRLDVETKSCKMSKKSVSYVQYRDKIGWFPWPFKWMWIFKTYTYLQSHISCLHFPSTRLGNISFNSKSFSHRLMGTVWVCWQCFWVKGKYVAQHENISISLFKDMPNLTSEKLWLHWYLWMSSKIRLVSLGLGWLHMASLNDEGVNKKLNY